MLPYVVAWFFFFPWFYRAIMTNNIIYYILCLDPYNHFLCLLFLLYHIAVFFRLIFTGVRGKKLNEIYLNGTS